MKHPVIQQIERAARKMAESQAGPRPFVVPPRTATVRGQAQKEAFDSWIFCEDLQKFIHRGDRRLLGPKAWRSQQPEGLVGRGGHVVDKVRKQIIPVRRFQSVMWEPESEEFPRMGCYNLFRPTDGETQPDWISSLLKVRVRIQR